MLFDTTNATITALEALATVYDNGDLITRQELDLAIQQAANSLANPPSFQLCTISSGTVGVERRGKLNYAKIETEGLVALDDATSITATGAQSFQVGDLLTILAATTGHDVRLVFTGIRNGAATLRSASDGVLLIYAPVGWREVARWPDAQTTMQSLETDSAVIESGAVNHTASLLYLSAISGEVRAKADVEITSATGAAGSITLFADDGSGAATLIGQFSYTSATSTASAATQLAASVDDVGIYTTQNLSGSGFEIVAPVGTGAGGNSHVISATVSGGLAATLGTFSGGSNGAEANATLQTIVGGSEGSELIARNSMATEQITLGSAGNIGVLSPMIVQPGDAVHLVYNAAIAKWCPLNRRAQSVGYLYFSNNATATTISNTTSFFPIAGTATATVENGFTITGNYMTLTGSSGLFEITASISFYEGNHMVAFGVEVNGAALPQSMRYHGSSAGQNMAAHLHVVAALQTGDVIKIAAKNEEAATDITVNGLQFAIKTLA